MNLRHLPFVCVVLAFLLVGCAESRTYDVSVKNDASKPVVVWLTKNGGPYEPVWRSPEDYAIERPGGSTDKTTGVYLQPGEHIGPKKITGQFDKGVSAILRVYLNPKSINDVLAIGPTSPDRVDVTLQPGENRLDVTDHAGKLSVAPAK